MLGSNSTGRRRGEDGEVLGEVLLPSRGPVFSDKLVYSHGPSSLSCEEDPSGSMQAELSEYCLPQPAKDPMG